MRRFVRRTVTVASAVALMFTGVLAAGVSPAQASTVQSGTYVSLGDSLAFGYQPNLVAAQDFNPADYVSYAEDYAAAQQPQPTVANFGCPGETTATMIRGGCLWLARGFPLHVAYTPYPSQLAAAVAYLRGHPDTSLVSVDIGSNDLNNVIDSCETTNPTNLIGCVKAQLPRTLGTLLWNYSTILRALRWAAPHAQLVVFNIYDPYANTQLDSLLRTVINPAISLVAVLHGARVADAFRAINYNSNYSTEQASVCALTWMCTFNPPNIHPTDLGYEAMAGALEKAVH